MTPLIPKRTQTKLLPKYLAMSPYQVYLHQLQSTLGPIRASKDNMDYLPPQLGGLSGQRQVIKNTLVLQIIDFEIN